MKIPATPPSDAKQGLKDEIHDLLLKRRSALTLQQNGHGGADERLPRLRTHGRAASMNPWVLNFGNGLHRPTSPIRSRAPTTLKKAAFASSNTWVWSAQHDHEAGGLLEKLAGTSGCAPVSSRFAASTDCQRACSTSRTASRARLHGDEVARPDQQIALGEGLGDEVLRAARSSSRFLSSSSAFADSSRIGRVLHLGMLAQLGDHLLAADAGHHDVGDDEIRTDAPAPARAPAGRRTRRGPRSPRDRHCATKRFMSALSSTTRTVARVPAARSAASVSGSRARAARRGQAQLLDEAVERAAIARSAAAAGVRRRGGQALERQLHLKPGAALRRVAHFDARHK